jgi:hypothetical protein
MPKTLGACLATLTAFSVAVACETAPSAPAPNVAPSSVAARTPSPSGNAVFRAEDAILAVRRASGVTPPEKAYAVFPLTVGSQSCDIQGGGPAPGIVVPGVCRTEVLSSGAGYVVKFTQMWAASRFHYEGDPSTGQLSTTWSFEVSTAGEVVGPSQSGNFPPEQVK